MNNILIISSRDLFLNGGEKNLTLNKDYSFRNYGWTPSYIVIRGLKRNQIDRSEFNFISSYSVFGSVLKIKKIKTEISRLNPEVVVFSGLISYIIFYLLGKKEYKVSLDYQGALEELLEYNNKGGRLFSNIFYSFFFFFEKHVYTNSNIIEIVSDNCRLHLTNKYGKTKAQFVLVPCGVFEVYNEDDFFRYRKKWRSSFSLRENEAAAVYAGGISKWQCIDDVMNFFLNHDYRAFVFSSEANIEYLRGKYPEAEVEYVTFNPSDLRQALCAFDIGLLPREIDSTNFVAWPNKASEYYNARLKIFIKNSEIGFYSLLKDAVKVIDYRERIKIQERIFEFDAHMIDVKVYVRDLINVYQD